MHRIILLPLLAISILLITLQVLGARKPNQRTDATKDPYAILNVQKHDSKKTFKKAYLACARKYHPDRNSAPDATSKFRDCTEAWKILDNDRKKDIYDTEGYEAVVADENGQRGGGDGAWSPLHDFFRFGGGGASRKQKDATQVIPLWVELEDCYNSKEFELDLKRQVLCPHCRGTGAKSPDNLQKCSACKGSGTRIVEKYLMPGFVQRIETTCNRCHGKGTIISQKCPVCDGRRVTTGSTYVTAHVEKGMQDGDLIVFESMGPQSPDSFPGDIAFEVRVRPHRVFYRREGDHLYMKYTISLAESLVGFYHMVEGLSGSHTIVLNRRGKVTPPGHVEVLPGMGMPERDFPVSNGKLYVEFSVIYNESLTEEQRRGIGGLLNYSEPSTFPMGPESGGSHGEL